MMAFDHIADSLIGQDMISEAKAMDNNNYFLTRKGKLSKAKVFDHINDYLSIKAEGEL